MRLSEFAVKEEYLQVREATAEDDTISSLITVLQFLKSRTDQTDGASKIKVKTLIGLMQNAGANGFTYAELVAANEIPAVQELIKTFNKDEITLALDNESPDDATSNSGEVDSADTVKKMAKKAAK